MFHMTESQFVDRFVSRICSLHPKAKPTDLLEEVVNNYLGADMTPEEAAALFADANRRPLAIDRSSANTRHSRKVSCSAASDSHLGPQRVRSNCLPPLHASYPSGPP